MKTMQNAFRIVMQENKITSWLKTKFHGSEIKFKFLNNTSKENLSSVLYKLPHSKTDCVDKNRANSSTISTTFFLGHQKTIKSRGTNEAKRKRNLERNRNFSLRSSEQSHSSGLSFISKHSFFLLEQHFFTQIKHAKSMTENTARLEPRLLFSSSAHSFELHTDKKIYSFAGGATVKSTRQKELQIDKVKFNAD